MAAPIYGSGSFSTSSVSNLTHSQEIMQAKADKQPMEPIESKKDLGHLQKEFTKLVKDGASLAERKQFLRHNLTFDVGKEFEQRHTEYKELSSQVTAMNTRLIEINSRLSKINDKLHSKLTLHKKALKNERTNLETEKKLLTINIGSVNSTLKDLESDPIFSAFKDLELNLPNHLETRPPFTEADSKQFELVAFQELKLNEILAPDCIELNFKPDLKKNDKLISSISFKDPETNVDGAAVITKAPIDKRFQPLQSMQYVLASKKATDPEVGASAVNTYDGTNAKACIFCDAYFHLKKENCETFYLTDGSGWGAQSRQAAQAAIFGASVYMDEALKDPSKIKSGTDVTMVMLKATEAAHKEIMKQEDGTPQENLHQIGTATFIMVFKFADQDGNVIVAKASVGDCKACFLTEDENGNVKYTDLDQASREDDPLNATDPGGRLGPYGEKVKTDPDLRNISINFMKIPNGNKYLGLIMSDGVADNFNPYNLGLSVEQTKAYLEGKPIPELPAHITTGPNGDRLSNEKIWGKLKKEWEDWPKQTASELIGDFQAKKFQEVVNEVKGRPLNEVCAYVTNYCAKTTAAIRTFFENPRSGRIPEDHITYPGKVDHTTIGGFSGVANAPLPKPQGIKV